MTAELRDRLNAFSRLYAFPSEPEPPPAGGFVILDSGAYGLSLRGKKMDDAHIEKLATHYKKYGDNQNIFGIAPDEFLNPRQSMQNYARWVERGRPPVAPVIQCRFAHKINLNDIRKQCEFYALHKPRFVAFSNPSMRGIEAEHAGVSYALALMRSYFRDAWIHNLGAGWDLQDIAAWKRVGFDSIDSIAYYTAAEQREAWRDDGKDWVERSVNNARAANTVASESV